MEDRNQLILVDLLEKEWFFTLLGPCLSFADLRNLCLSSKPTQVAVRALVGTWPEEVRELLGTWCGKTPSSLLIFGTHGANDVECRYRHPAPIIRFQVDSLSYDDESKNLLGQPWSEVVANNSQPRALGRNQPNVCSANNSGSKIFYCGGRNYVDGGDNVDDTRWINPRDMIDRDSVTTGIFDIDTGIWTQLPQMPEPRSGAGIFRIGSRIYVLGGERSYEWDEAYHSIRCFDLDQECWIDSGCDEFPVDAYEGYVVVVIDDSTVLVAGGSMITDWHDENGNMVGSSRQVFSLNINSGVWTQLSDLPESVCEDPIGSLLKPKDQQQVTAVVMGKETWARLLPNGEWEVSPDLRGFELTAIRLDSVKNEIFSGNKWLALPPHHNLSGSGGGNFGVQVGDMKLCWRGNSPTLI